MGSVVDSQLCKIGITAAALHHEEPDLFEEMMHFVDPRAGQWPPPVVEGLAAVAELCIKFHARKRASDQARHDYNLNFKLRSRPPRLD